MPELATRSSGSPQAADQPPLLVRLAHLDGVNFWITNALPRRLITRLMGALSLLEHPTLVRMALSVWQWFGGDLNLHEAKKPSFVSVHDCFTRELRPGARPIDQRPEVIVSPCDAIVVASGRINGNEMIQAKGQTYTLDDLLVDHELSTRHRHGTFVTLRLTSTMYHRFHAPDAGHIDRELVYVAGDTWNVNGPALRRIPRLYCRNERVVLPMQLESGELLTLVPVAAILVGSIHLHFLDVLLHLGYDGPRRIPCGARFGRGQELGYFHHGSTIVVLAGQGLSLCNGIGEGTQVRMGQALLRRSPAD